VEEHLVAKAHATCITTAELTKRNQRIEVPVQELYGWGELARDFIRHLRSFLRFHIRQKFESRLLGPTTYLSVSLSSLQGTYFELANERLSLMTFLRRKAYRCDSAIRRHSKAAVFSSRTTRHGGPAPDSQVPRHASHRNKWPEPGRFVSGG
jgi:hypothetical protein